MHNMTYCTCCCLLLLLLLLFFQAGNYTLTNTVPSGTNFSHWECYNTTSGTASPPVNGSSISLAPATSFTCVAVFIVLPPQPRLALLSNFLGTSNYTGTPANLNATGPAVCVEAPAARLGGNITITNPLDGLCNGNGNMPVSDTSHDAAVLNGGWNDLLPLCSAACAAITNPLQLVMAPQLPANVTAVHLAFLQFSSLL
jgi:hypothetical protein